MEQVESKKYTRFEWFIYIIFFPLVFALALSLILLPLLGYNVFDTAKTMLNSIPYVERLIPDNQVTKQVNSKDLIYNEVINKEKEIEQLKIEIEQKKQEIEKLQNELTNVKKANETKKQSEAERIKEIQTLAQMYSTMDPKKAATILAELTTEEILLIMNNMSLDKRMLILQNMPPAKAAEISVLLKDQVYSVNSDIAALQSRVNELVKLTDQLKNQRASYIDLAKTYLAMDPAKAGEILKKMMDVNINNVVKIFAAMNPEERSVILAAMDPIYASKITTLLLQ